MPDRIVNASRSGDQAFSSGSQRRTSSTAKTPIDILPNELLLVLFALLTRNNDIDHPMKNGGSSAHVIGAVCSRWRSLAISSPDLWSNFKIWLGFSNVYHGFSADSDSESSDSDTVSQAPPASKDPRSCIVDLYITRSRSHPLTLTIHAAQTWGDRVTRQRDHPILKKLSRLSSRWQHISLSLFLLDSDIYHSLRSLDLPLLETVSIDQEVYGYADLSVFLRAPKLRSLNMDKWGFNTPSPNSITRSVLEGLETLKYSPNYQNMFTVLPLCTNLRCLRVEDMTIRTDNRAFVCAPPLAVPGLECLRVAGYSVAPHGDLLHMVMTSLSAQGLTALVLHQMVTGPVLNQYLSLRLPLKGDSVFVKAPSPFEAIDGFILRSGCMLTRLVLDGLPLSDVEVLTLLRRLPSLTNLTIKDSYDARPRDDITVTEAFAVTDSLAEGLRLDSSHVPIVPNLHELNLESRSSDIDLGTVIYSILSRCQPGELESPESRLSGLHSVELRLCKYTPQQAQYLASLACSSLPVPADGLLRNAGMRVFMKQCGNLKASPTTGEGGAFPGRDGGGGESESADTVHSDLIVAFLRSWV